VSQASAEKEEAKLLYNRYLSKHAVELLDVSGQRRQL